MFLTYDGLVPTDTWKDVALGVILGAIASAVFALVLTTLSRLRQRRPRNVLLGPLAKDRTTISVFIRPMFVPNKEFFSREPDYQPGMAGTITVRKWPNIPEVYAAGDVRAASDVLRLLGDVGRNQVIAFRSIEADWKNWSEDTIAIGGHFKTFQILEACEPRIVGFRNPDAFRSLVSTHIFEAAGQSDCGLIFKGYHPASRRTFLVVMGLGAIGTEAAAHFLRVNAAPLGSLTAGAPFAAVVTVDSTQGPQGAVLHWMHPKPTWWRRLLYWSTWKKLSRKMLRPGT